MANKMKHKVNNKVCCPNNRIITGGYSYVSNVLVAALYAPIFHLVASTCIWCFVAPVHCIVFGIGSIRRGPDKQVIESQA